LSTDFPVVWDEPSDADRSWTRDQQHSPDPLRPLGGEFGYFVAHGFTFAFRYFSIPVAAFRCRTFNGYLYTSIELVDAPPEELERLAGVAQAHVAGAMATLGDSWANTYLPEIKTLLAELETFDLGGASTDGLRAHWERLYEIELRLYEIHFLVLLPTMFAISEFDELYRGLTQSEDPYAAYRLLGGLDNLTLATGRALWELSRKALASPEVLSVIDGNDACDVVASLEASAPGREFLTDLRAYLDYYGQRGDLWDVSYPSWIEDPTPVIANLKRYVHNDSHPAAELEHAAAEREEAIAGAREELKDNDLLPMFEFLLKGAHEGVVLTEDHGFWIDFRGGYQFRRVALEFGRRFAHAGELDDAGDVFFLYPKEMTAESIDRRALVATRKAELEQWRRLTPPPSLGAPPPDLPLQDNPLVRAFEKFGGTEPIPSTGSEVTGNAGSPGCARGRARIIRTIADADRLEPGDVLVSETTSPPWTPLFAIASAVVTDAGGVLSHCAVVAREYQIPAVVGCGDATAKIRDGQSIEVDGTEGIVRILG
jgi:pyruvate,water dikinase